MISPSHSTKVFLCRRPVDFRCGYDRLAYHCKKVAREDPYSGSVFLFFNRDFTRAKIIYFDGTGSVMIWKRLEMGTFKVPKISHNKAFATINGLELLVLLEGLSTQKMVSTKKIWRPGPFKLENYR